MVGPGINAASERRAIRRYPASVQFSIPNGMAAMARRRTEFILAHVADHTISELCAWAWLQGIRDAGQTMDSAKISADAPIDWASTG